MLLKCFAKLWISTSCFLIVLKEGQSDEDESPPTDQSVVQIKHPNYIRITYYDPGEDWENEHDDDKDYDDESMGEDKVGLLL